MPALPPRLARSLLRALAVPCAVAAGVATALPGAAPLGTALPIEALAALGLSIATFAGVVVWAIAMAVSNPRWTAVDAAMVGTGAATLLTGASPLLPVLALASLLTPGRASADNDNRPLPVPVWRDLPDHATHALHRTVRAERAEDPTPSSE